MIDIQHAHWQPPRKDLGRKHKAPGTFTYDAFVNPDTQSSIAAVVVRRYASNDNSETSMDVSLVSNRSRGSSRAVQALWKQHGLTGIDYAPYAEVEDGLAKLRVDVPPELTAILIGQESFHEDATAAKLHTEERLAHLVATFRSSCVLSESVAVCTAFLEAMCHELADFRAIYQGPDKNKRGGL